MEISILLTVAVLSLGASLANAKHERVRRLAEWKLRDPQSFKAWERAHHHDGRRLGPIGV